jgi:Domain of unknown function (DUF4157)
MSIRIALDPHKVAAASSAGRSAVRRCGCGRPIVANGRCAHCAARPAVAGLAHVPNVLAHPGRPLGGSLRRQLERALSLSGPRTAGVSATADEREAERAGAAFSRDSARPARPRGRGTDLSGVRIHTGGAAGASARSVNARAYTVGRDIVFGAGEYAPHTSRGRELLGHEAAHVLQDRRGGPRVLRRQLLVDEPAGPETEAPVADDLPETAPPPPPEPPSFERLVREHPAEARSAMAVSRGFRALLASCRPVVERSGLLEQKTEVVFWVSVAVPRALDYEQEIADKQLLDASHLSTWLEHVRAALTRLAPLLDALDRTNQRHRRRRLDAERQRVLAQVEQLSAGSFIRTGVETRERERTAAAAQARIDAAVDYLRDMAARHHDRAKSPDQLRIFGPLVASNLVHKMKLNGDEIRAAFDTVKVEDPEVLDAVLFGGGTVQSLLYMGIPGFQAYRARGEGFLSGFYRGSRESLLVAKPGKRTFSALERVEASIWFVLGAFQGIGDALIDNVKSVLTMFTPKFWSELWKFFKEQLPEFIDHEETRFAAGMMMGQMSADEERRVAQADAQEYGRSVGHMFGVAIVEIVLLFIGLGWVLKAVQASKRLMKALEPLFKLAKYLGELAAVRKGLRLVQLLSEGVGILSRRIRALLLRVPALTQGGKARRALSLAELAVEEAAAEARRAEDAVRRALALGDMAAAEKHMKELEAAARKVQSKVEIFEAQGAGVYDEAAAAAAKAVEPAPPREQRPATRAPEREVPAERPREGGADPEAKARTLEEVDAELAKRQRTLDGEHEVYVEPDGDAVVCSECVLIWRRYRRELKQDPKLRRRLDDIRARTKQARKTGDKKLADQVNDDTVALEAELSERWVDNTMADAARSPGDPLYHLPPDEPPHRADPRARGAATEVSDLEDLARTRGVQKLPDWFKTLDGIEGEAKIVVRKGKTYLVFEDAKGLSLKSTQIVDPVDLERKLLRDLADLLAFDDYTRGRVRVKDLKERTLRLTFEEGTFKHVEQAGLQDLLKRFAASAKKRGATFEWGVWLHGKFVEGPTAIQLMKLLEL